ncbi:MAG: hypothetical protein M1832_004602 [Thelocarpon impressellum]|nr:MAG: hypothetical protein M1832_004602 [Thelocarpon impressellum]
MNIGDRSDGDGFGLHGSHPARTHPSERRPANRVPYLGWVSNNVRNHFIAMSGEFVGTFLFLFFAFSGTQVANSTPSTSGGKTSQSDGPNIPQLLYISLCFGFSLVVNAWVFFRISGGLFNPAVTLGMCLVGAVPWFRGGLVFVSQILGAISSAAVVSCLFPGPLNVDTMLNGGTSVVQGLFIEMFLTAELVFTIFMLAAEKHRGTFIAPVGIGLALFAAELTGVYFTGGSLNPARSFGPAVATRLFKGYHWIYWLGPALGSILAAGLYKLIKKLEYETANPGQDEDDERRVPSPDDHPDKVKFPRTYDPEKGEGRRRGEQSASPDQVGDGHGPGAETRRKPLSMDMPSVDGRRSRERGRDGNAAVGRAYGGQTETSDPPQRRAAGQGHSPRVRSERPADSRGGSIAVTSTHTPRNAGRYEYDDRGNPVPSGYVPPGVPSSDTRFSSDANRDRRTQKGDEAAHGYFPPGVGRV